MARSRRVTGARDGPVEADGGGSDAWPLLGGPARPIASLPYFDMLDVTSAYLLHFDIDVSMRFAAGGRPAVARGRDGGPRAAPALRRTRPRGRRARLCAGARDRAAAAGPSTRTGRSGRRPRDPALGTRLLMDVARYRRSTAPAGLRPCKPRGRRRAHATRSCVFDKTHGPGRRTAPALASRAALLAGFQRADLCGDRAVRGTTATATAASVRRGSFRDDPPPPPPGGGGG